jgi:trehalose utilization protein
MSAAVRVLIWNEHRHEKTNRAVAAIYPDGIHAAIAAGLRDPRLEVLTGTLDEPEQGLADLDSADVLVWWGHAAHDEVLDANVDRIQERVRDGLGLVALHSAHYSKIFRRLMGTSCALKWREADDRERLWLVAPDHPIAEGMSEYFELEREEMYGEFFDIPTPERLVFVGWFTGGEVFRSGVTYTRGRGRIFYFQPGHETYPTYHDPNVQRVIRNAVLWAAAGSGPRPTFGNRSPLEPR